MLRPVLIGLLALLACVAAAVIWGNLRWQAETAALLTGLIESVRAESRGRTVKGTAVPTPWEGRWRSYTVWDGMRVPTEGEVAWVLPDGPRPYWRGRLTGARYQFAE